MRTSRIIVSIVSTILICLLLFWRLSSLSGNGTTAFPNHPIQVVVPYAAGGGTDTFARIIQKSVASRGLLPQPLVIINQPGGVGTIGSRFVLGSRPDGYRILCHHDSVLTAELSGTVTFGPDDFSPIAQTGNLTTLVVVREDSPFLNLTDLLEEASANPKSIRFGADVGSPAYFNAKVIERSKPGAEVNYISSGGGQKRFTQLLGGHLEAAIFSLGEYSAYRASDGTPPDQNIRAIAVLDGSRSRILPNVPTAAEQNIPIYSGNAYYYWAPKGTPQVVIDKLADVLQRTMKDPEVIAGLEQQSIGLDFRKGKELIEYVSQKKGELGNFKTEASPDLPNFPAWVIAIVAGLGALVIIGKLRKPDAREEQASKSGSVAMVAAGIMLGYIMSLQLGMPYGLVTAPALFLLGAALSEWQRRRLIPIAQMALLFALGSEYIFTTVFSVPLP
jgi:tripartite-type tricarboxylate transporter receptor subunit TctC